MATKVQDFLQKNPNYIGYANTSNRAAAPVVPQAPGGLSGALIGAVKGIGRPFGYFGEAVFGTPIREIAAQVTGNEKAYRNAAKRGNKNLNIGKDKSFASGLKTWAGNSAQLGLTLAAPATNTIKGGAAVGAGFGGSSSLARDESLEEALKQAAIGGALGGAFTGAGKLLTRGGNKAAAGAVGGVDDVTKAAKLSGGSNATTRAGDSLYRSTLGIDDIILPNKQRPGTIFKADELVKEARRIGLKGSPKAMQRQVAAQYDFLNKEVTSKLAQSKDTIGYQKLYDSAVKEVANKLPLRVDGVPVKSELARSLNQLKSAVTGGIDETELSRLLKAGQITPTDYQFALKNASQIAGGNQIDASAIHAFKNSLPVDSAFNKLKSGGNLTAKETVDLALWKEADNWITKLAPAAKELTTRQSKLYELSHGLGRMTRTPGDARNLSDLAIRVASPGVRKAQNFAGRSLMNIGGAESRVGANAGALGKLSNTPKIGIAAHPVSGGLAVRAPNVPADQSANLTPDALYGPGAIQTAMGGAGAQMPQQQFQSAYPLEQAIADLQANPNPKTQKQIMDYYDFVSGAEAAQQKAQGGGTKLDAVAKRQIANVKTAETIVGQLKTLFGKAGGAKGFGGYPTLLTSKTPINSAQKTYTDTRQSYTSRLVRALGEVGTLNEGDIKRVASAIPNYNDTPESAQAKWDFIEGVLADTRNQTYGVAGGYEETPQDMVSALQQLQGGY